MQNTNDPQRSEKTDEGNAPRKIRIEGAAAEEFVKSLGNRHYTSPLEREIAARDTWNKWQQKYPFTLDPVDRFLLALDRLEIRPLDGFIATPDKDDYTNTTSFSHITVHGFSDVRMVCETGEDEGGDLDDAIAETVELEAYHRGLNVWVVVPTSQVARAQMVTLIEAIKVEEAR